MGFLPNSSCVHTTIQMHHIEITKKDREKAKWELHKNPACSLEQMQEVTLHKTAPVRPPASHLTNPLCKTNKTYGTLDSFT